MKKNVKHSIGWLAVLWLGLLMPARTILAQTPVATPAVKASEGEGKGCCAFALQFVNLHEHSHYIKKIRVSAMCDTRICCADPDEWAQAGHEPEYVDWFPADSSYVPFGNAIDNEFLIYLSSETDPYDLMVEWFDGHDNIVCRHTIQISCKGHDKEDEDWTLYTSKTALNDDRLFVFAVREEEEDEDACDDLRKSGFCIINSNIECLGTEDYYVTLSTNDDWELYQWAVVSGPATPSISSAANTSVILTTPGTYLIAMDATDLDTGETCSTETEIVIPGFAPDFTTERVPSPCSATFKFKPFGAGDPDVVTGVTWSCVGIPGFPSYCTYDNTVQYNFTAPGTYSVTMTIMDIYGCAHSIEKDIVVDFNCHAAAEVDKYYLCADCSGEHNVEVFFKNTSTGGTCPLTFTWDFGDGSTPLVTNETMLTVSHVYTVPNCAVSTPYTVTITMTDSNSSPCSSTASFPLNIAPCRPDVTYRVCPDGKIVCSSTMLGTFSIDPSLPVVSSGTSIPNTSNLINKITYQASTPGTYTVSFEGHCNTGGRCIVSKSIVVSEVHCCAKNDAERDRFEFAVSGNDYRMKYKMVQRQFILYHKIRLKTKLKKHKNLWGIGYWKGTKADQIEAHCQGTIYKSDAICNCVLPNNIDDGVVKTNKTKAKLNISVGERFRSRINSLVSSHRVVKDGYDVTKYLDLGNDCD